MASLSWWLQLGDDPEKKIKWLRQLEADGHQPKVLRERVEVRDDLIFYWRAFTVLNESRQIGMAPGPIPLSEIKTYLEIFPEEDAELFIALIRAMDRTYIDHARRRQKS